MAVRVKTLGAHVGTCPHKGVACSKGACKDGADTKVSNLDLLLAAEENVGRFDVTVDNPVPVEIIQAFEDLFGNLCEVALGDGFLGFNDVGKGSAIHVFKHKRDLTSFIRCTITLDDVRITSSAKDVHLCEDLLADSQLVLLLDDFKGIEFTCALVLDLIDFATATMP